jgi:hypothetical protein
MSDRELNGRKGQKFAFSTKDNSQFKWMDEDGVMGALEIASDPELDVHEEYVEKYAHLYREKFDAALQVWEEMRLRDQFIAATEQIPPEASCCGMIVDNEATMRKLVPALNKGWIKHINKKLKKGGHEFKVDMFILSWQSPLGKAETCVLLIRFITLAP